PKWGPPTLKGLNPGQGTNFSFFFPQPLREKGRGGWGPNFGFSRRKYTVVVEGKGFFGGGVFGGRHTGGGKWYMGGAPRVLAASMVGEAHKGGIIGGGPTGGGGLLGRGPGGGGIWRRRPPGGVLLAEGATGGGGINGGGSTTGGGGITGVVYHRGGRHQWWNHQWRWLTAVEERGKIHPYNYSYSYNSVDRWQPTMRLVGASLGKPPTDKWGPPQLGQRLVGVAEWRAPGGPPEA
ncbi:acanthoscurrin-1-like, partial [Penaeus monodon]|uniref:acanthoscurrin-1-like n=1 Tax=Penaeus monodon TaxID=6687 RepID=UPI0018A7C383